VQRPLTVVEILRSELVAPVDVVVVGVVVVVVDDTPVLK
jgi:hypothetical protein